MTASSDATVASLFCDQAARTPHATAVIVDRATTYGDLDDRVRRIAAALASVASADETPVGVLLPRSIDLVATLLASMYAGTTHVPTEPDHPRARIEQIFAHAGCDTVVCDATTANLVPAGSRPLLIEDALRVAPIAAEPCTGGSRRAYVLFTSGSTGTPKGVEVEHHSLLALVQDASTLLDAGPADRFLGTSTVTFDVSLAEWFVPLTTGGCLVLRDRDILTEPTRLASDIDRHAITVVTTSASVWGLVLGHSVQIPRLRAAISTGESLPATTAAKLVTVADQAWNLYGPTETTVWSTGEQLSAEFDAQQGPVAVSAPIGVPLPSDHAMVVDEFGLRVPDGAEGELWLGGAGVSRGYLDDPALTAQRFVEGAGEERLYRSGDRAVVRNGLLHHLGRFDDQVQLRGIRIEPTEIEAAIATHEAVALCAVAVFETASGDQALGAVVVAVPGTHPSSYELRSYTAGLLPHSVVPSSVLIVEQLPSTASDKLDRAAVAELLTGERAGSSSAVAADRDAPNGTRERLGALLADLLGLDEIGDDDRFISLGGDSIAAFRLMIEIDASFAVDLTPIEIFDLTVGEMAAAIDQRA